MAYEPHIRMTMLGKIGATSGEIFSMGISLGRQDQVAGSGGLFQDLLNAKPDEGVFTAWRDNVTAWFQRSDTRILGNANLTRVKFASIGADGLYTEAPREYAVNVFGGGVSDQRPAFQTAVAVTLGTDGDLGRIKGRFYQPVPAVTIDGGTGLMSEADRTAITNSADQLLTDLANQPGLDVLNLGAVVASQGRRTPAGVLRVPPGNHPVVRVGVGRSLDTIRRRRNALPDTKVFQGTGNF